MLTLSHLSSYISKETIHWDIVMINKECSQTIWNTFWRQCENWEIWVKFEKFGLLLYWAWLLSFYSRSTESTCSIFLTLSLLVAVPEIKFTNPAGELPRLFSTLLQTVLHVLKQRICKPTFQLLIITVASVLFVVTWYTCLWTICRIYIIPF